VPENTRSEETIHLNAFLKRRDDHIRKYWKSDIKPILRSAENDIIQRIKSTGTTDWQLSRLQAISESLSQVIGTFSARYEDAIVRGDALAAEDAARYIDLVAKDGGLNVPQVPYNVSRTIEMYGPISRQMAQNFSGDMLNIVKSEVSLGLASGESTDFVAKRIQDKFGIDSIRRSKLEDQKEALAKKLRGHRISEKQYIKKVKRINNFLEQGSMMSYARAQRIARTEMLTASSFTQNERANQIAEIDPNTYKGWSNAHKPDARETHLAAEKKYMNTPIPLDEDFVVGGFKCSYPRDPRLPAKERVNCACTMVIVNRSRRGELEEVFDDRENTIPDKK